MEPCSFEIGKTHPLAPKGSWSLLRETKDTPYTQAWPHTSPRLLVLLWSPEPQREAERTEIAPTFQGE